MNFEIKLAFLIKLFSLHDQKVKTKNLNALRIYKVFMMK